MSHGPVILVAHARATQRQRLCHVVERAGYEVVAAVDVPEALRFAEGIGPAAVLADAGLAGLEDLIASPSISKLIMVVADHERTVPLPVGLPVVQLAGLSARQLVQRLALLLVCRSLRATPAPDLSSAAGDLGGFGLGELLHKVRQYRLTGRLALQTARGAGLWLHKGAVVDAWWGALRGAKAFCRLATLRQATWRLALDARSPRATLDGDLESLVDQALDESLQLEEELRHLPSLGARVEIGRLDGDAARDLDPVEHAVLRHALTARTLADLLDMPGASDSDVARAVGSLCRRQLLGLADG